jgi:diaminohydroxyphosphoribosylaminopyrimidine deaminase/5-amino-6-(5-phosphoribosylamino)uracil reductase
VTLKAALTLDARVAAGPGLRTKITGAASDRRAHRERAEVDAIAVGSSTVLADDPLLTVRGVYRERPLARILFDTRLRTPPNASVLSTLDAGPVIIVTTAQAAAAHADRAAQLGDAGAELQVHETGPGGRPSVTAALERLLSRGVTSVVIEGGPSLHGSAWDEGIVDRVQLFVSPRPAGAHGVRWLPFGTLKITDLVDVTVETLGEDVLVQGYVHRPH